MPGTGRAVMRVRCQNEPGGWMAEIVERAVRDLKRIMGIQPIGIPAYTTAVYPANNFASSV
jgi:hypothetical protein